MTDGSPGVTQHPILAELRAALPEARLLAGSEEVEPYRRDETEFLYPPRKCLQYLPRGNAVAFILFIEVEFTLIELEGIDAAGIDDLYRQRLGRLQGPCDVVGDERLVDLFGQ